MSGNKLTIKEVARRLDVSTATISNAFNRPDQLSEKKRHAILASCEAMGYFGPNKAARSLRQGTSNIIALILPDELDYMMSDPVATQFMQGVAQTFKASGKHLLLFSGNNPSVSDVFDFVDGFICYGSPRNTELLAQLPTIQKPLVTIDFDINTAPSVNIDNEEAAYQVAKMALQAHNKHPVILGLRLLDEPLTCSIENKKIISCDYSVSHRRLDGYKRALAEHNITIDDHSIWHIPESAHDYAIVAARQALAQIPKPTVLLCMSDIIALTAMQEALRLGLRVPQDIRIVGFDGIEQGQRYHPTLATVQQFSVEKGQKAAEMFLNGYVQNEILDFKVILGESAPIK
jgi:DNA-binding LacI/PurR family transcriptional regulator